MAKQTDGNLFTSEYGNSKRYFFSNQPISLIGNTAPRKQPKIAEKEVRDFRRDKKHFIEKTMENFENEKELTFVTLTFHPNITDRSYTDTRLKIWFKQLKRDIEKEFGKEKAENFKYVYAVELQRRGAIHYHILMNIWFDGSKIHPLEIWVNQNNHYWNDVLTDEERNKLDAEFKGKSKAEVKANDITKVDSKIQFTPELAATMEAMGVIPSNAGIALYMSKYFSKMDSGKGFRTKEMKRNQKIFGFSHNCRKVSPTAFNWDEEEAIKMVHNIPQNYPDKSKIAFALNDYLSAKDVLTEFTRNVGEVNFDYDNPNLRMKTKLNNDMMNKWVKFLKLTFLSEAYRVDTTTIAIVDENTNKPIMDGDKPMKYIVGISAYENKALSKENYKQWQKEVSEWKQLHPKTTKKQTKRK